MKNILLIFILLWSAQMNAQNCNTPNHSTNSNDSWLSCEMMANPNSERGISHWVMYDLGYVYTLGATHFWNYNVEGATMNGMRNIIIDISMDGTDWTTAGDFQLSQANENANYEGAAGIDFGGANARFILITALDTWQGNCAGLSEVKFDINDIASITPTRHKSNGVSLFPNPTRAVLNISFTENRPKEIIVQNSAGNEIIRVNVDSFIHQIDTSMLPSGMYLCQIIGRDGKVVTRRFVIAQ